MKTTLWCTEYKGAERGAVRGLILFFVCGPSNISPAIFVQTARLHHLPFFIFKIKCLDGVQVGCNAGAVGCKWGAV